MSTDLDEILATHGLDKNSLMEILSKEDRQELCERIQDWKAVGVVLGFTQEEVKKIDNSFENVEGKKNNLFWKWIMKHRREATYLKLAQVLFEGGLRDLLEDLCAIIVGTMPKSPIVIEPSQCK